MADRKFDESVEPSGLIAGAALAMLLIFSLIALAVIFFGS